MSRSEGGCCRQLGCQNFSGVASPGIVIACQVMCVTNVAGESALLCPLGAGAEAPVTAMVARFSQGLSF